MAKTQETDGQEVPTILLQAIATKSHLLTLRWKEYIMEFA